MHCVELLVKMNKFLINFNMVFNKGLWYLKMYWLNAEPKSDKHLKIYPFKVIISY